MTTITLHQALRSVAAHDPDNARERNDVGFSGFDTRFACDMAARDTLSAKQEWHVARFCWKYRKQVVANYERAGEQITQGLKGKARKAAVEAFLYSLVWEHQGAEEVAKATKPKSVISAACGVNSGDVKHFVVRFPYAEGTIHNLKLWTDWRDRSFDKSDPKDPKWILQPTVQTVDCLRRLVQHFGFYATDGAVAAFEKVIPSQVAA